jgi:hypothetical protein
MLGAPLDKVGVTLHGPHLNGLLVDGNRVHQQEEAWRFASDGTRLNNNAIMVWNVDEAVIEHVTCRRGRSGGLVSGAGTRRMTVRDFTAYDNQFDGLACYQTRESHFSQLNLHDNLAAGISLDLSFVHNIIDDAALTANDVGIFMRQSRDNVFTGVIIRRSRHDGIFMAQAGESTSGGWRLLRALNAPATPSMICAWRTAAAGPFKSIMTAAPTTPSTGENL